MTRGHPDLNQGPVELQSNALPLSYAPFLSVAGLECAFLEQTAGLHHHVYIHGMTSWQVGIGNTRILA